MWRKQTADEHVRPHVVRAGDHVAALAARHGLSPSEVWDHERNRELRAQRGTGQILAPGDVVYLPAAARRAVPVQKGVNNRVRGRLPPTIVRIRLRTETSVVRNEACRVEGTGVLIETHTDDEGRLEVTVPATTPALRVAVLSRGLVINLRIGHLDPVDTESGIVQRLENIGYLFALYMPHDMNPHLTASMNHTDHQRRRMTLGLKQFQANHGLKATGEPDQTTIQALRKAHGV